MNLEDPIPPIKMHGVTSYADWLAGRKRRREISQRIAPGINRRAESSSDKRLRAAFNGERGLPFKPTEEL